mgnify:CR=1 FL=1
MTYGRCECCGKGELLQKHHKYANYKYRRKLYGTLMDHLMNISYVCADCHASHRSPELTTWNEREFCLALGISPRSKSAGQA